MESGETWRSGTGTPAARRTVASLQRKVKRQSERPVQVQELVSPERREELHERCIELMEEAQSANDQVKEGLLLQALKLSASTHDPQSFLRSYLHGLVGDCLWTHSAREHQAGQHADSTQLLNRALDHFAAFEVGFSRRIDEVFLPITDKFDWRTAEDGTPLWVFYVSLLKSFAAALGFKLIGFMPLMTQKHHNDTEDITRSEEFKLVRRHTPTMVSKLTLRTIVRGSALPDQSLSGWAKRAVTMASAQSRDFLENPLDGSPAEDKEATTLISEIGQVVGVRRNCSWAECSKQEAFPGDFSLCGRCRLVRYCCKEHQAADWRARHRKICSVPKEEEHI